MSGALAYADPADLATGDVVGGSEEERAAAFSTYLSYCGTYEVEGDVVVHHIEMSLFPNWVGGEQKRQFEPSDDKLVLRTPPLETGGDVIVNELAEAVVADGSRMRWKPWCGRCCGPGT